MKRLALASPLLGILVACLGQTNFGGDAGTDDSGNPPGDSSQPDTGSPQDVTQQPDAPGPGGVTAPNGYYTAGNTIYDTSNKSHLFHGLDRPSLEWNANGDNLSPQDYQHMAAWKANVVRISLNQDFWLSTAPQYSAGYQGLVDQQITQAKSNGLDVILDLHWSDRGTFSTPAQQPMADAHSITFWQQVAGKYKGDGRVMFELYNEPQQISWDVWLNGGSTNGMTAVGMQQLYNAVRVDAGAENLVFIGGIQWAYDLSGVPGHLVNGHNIVYVTHPYNQSGKQPANWDSGFGFLTSSYPVMATEFGNTADCTTTYYSSLIPYMDQHKMSWSGWAWYVSGCNFPSVITDWAGTPSASGQIEKTALAAY
jgi:hypothetical protein